MADLSVTVPKQLWATWLNEGDLPGDPPGGAFEAYDFSCDSTKRPQPPIEPGERVYIIAHGRLRGYAPLVEIAAVGGRWSLVRAGGAVALTIPGAIRGFQGWRKRWWERDAEVPFPEWRYEGVLLRCNMRGCRGEKPIVYIKDEKAFCDGCVQRNIARRAELGEPYPAEWIAEVTARGERIRVAAERELLEAEARV